MPEASETLRYCPLCEANTVATVCATHGVPTVRADILEEDEVLPLGVVINQRYRVDRLLGKGGMGSVVLATQLGMDRQVAVKTLNKDMTGTPEFVKRFYREAKAMVQMEHPNVVKVFDFGIDDATGTPYLVMELLRGRTLADVLDDEVRLTERRACRLLAQVAKALVEASAKGIVHRDLKPENIHVHELADGDEFVKVLDFGIAKVEGQKDQTKNLTEAGTTVGTPVYMSPEQVLGKRVDTRSDLYAVGCLLYECLSGRPPFDGEEATAIFVAQITKQPPPLPATLVDGQAPSADVVDMVTRLLKKDPAERPGTASEVAKLLGAIARGDAGGTAAAAELLGGPQSEPDAQAVNALAPTMAGTPAPMNAVVADGMGPTLAKQQVPLAGRDTAALTTPEVIGGDDGEGPGPWVYAVLGLLLLGLAAGGAWAAGVFDAASEADPPAKQPAAEVAATSDATPPKTVAAAPAPKTQAEPKPPVIPKVRSEPVQPEPAPKKEASPTPEKPAEPKPAPEPVEASETGPQPEKTPPVEKPAEPEKTPATSADPAPKTEPGPSKPAAPALPDPAPVEVTSAPPAPYVVEVSSKPKGAIVKRGDEALGKTPLKLPVPADGLSLTLMMNGFAKQTVALNHETPTELLVKMKRKRPAAAKKPKKGKPKIGVW